MAIPDYQTLMLPVLELAAQGETSIQACIAALADRLGLTADQRGEVLPSGRQTVFANRVHWAKTYLSQAGLLDITRRGHFKATPRGLEILARHPERVDNEVLVLFPEFWRFASAPAPVRIHRNGRSTSTPSTISLPPRLQRSESRRLMARSPTSFAPHFWTA